MTYNSPALSLVADVRNQIQGANKETTGCRDHTGQTLGSSSRAYEVDE